MQLKLIIFVDQVDFTKTKKQSMAIGHRYYAGAGCGLDLAVQCSAWQGCEKVQISCLAACVECRVDTAGNYCKC